jgi:hypothetical protein
VIAKTSQQQHITTLAFTTHQSSDEGNAIKLHTLPRGIREHITRGRRTSPARCRLGCSDLLQRESLKSPFLLHHNTGQATRAHIPSGAARHLKRLAHYLLVPLEIVVLRLHLLQAWAGPQLDKRALQGQGAPDAACEKFLQKTDVAEP